MNSNEVNDKKWLEVVGNKSITIKKNSHFCGHVMAADIAVKDFLIVWPPMYFEIEDATLNANVEDKHFLVSTSMFGVNICEEDCNVDTIFRFVSHRTFGNFLAYVTFTKDQAPTNSKNLIGHENGKMKYTKVDLTI